MWLKWLKRILVSLGILIALVIGFVLIVVFMYEDEVKKFATAQLNKHLKVNVHVKPSDIELTLWDQFPQASLRFSDVLIPDYTSENQKDTMLFAKNIYFNFDFWDMMSGKYEVKNVVVRDAIAKVKVTDDGVPNYDIWKSENTDKDPDNSFSFALEKLIGENLQISYENGLKNEKFDFDAKDILFEGKFTNKQYDLKSTADLNINEISIDSVTYIKDKPGELDLDLAIDNDKNVYRINKGALNVAELLFSSSGTYCAQEDSNRIDLNIKGKNIDLASAFSIFPKKYVGALGKYNAQGLVVFNMDINGEIDSIQSPKVVSNFYVEGGSLVEKISKTTLSNISLSGHFNSDTLSSNLLTLSDVSANLDVGTIAGSLRVEDLSSPNIKANTNGNINLYLLHNFLRNTNVEILTGNSDFAFNLAMHQENGSMEIDNSKGTFHIQNGKLKLPSSPILYSSVNGTLKLNNNNASFEKIKGNAQTSDFEMTGKLNNLIPYMFDANQTLSITADLTSKEVDLDPILNSKKPEVAFASQPEAFNLPQNIKLSLSTKVDKLTMGKLNASKIKGSISLADQKITANNCSFKANKGNYKLSFGLEQLPDNQFLWDTKINAKQVDIKNFFKEMDNFGQDFLTDENIKGKANMDLDLAFLLSPYFDVNVPSIKAKSSITIKNGELINQPTLAEIGAYFSEQKITKRVLDTDKFNKKIKHVKFKELKNTLSIENEKIFIPKMSIASNIMDISVGGWHGFNDSIDYHFNFRLRDVLVQNESEEFGPIQDDELGVKLFLHMFGTLDNPNYELDKEERKLERKEAIAEEKANVKSILKSELGIFKNDSTVAQYKAPEKAPVKWELESFSEDDPKEVTASDNGSTTEKQTKKPKDKKDSKFNKFLKKMGVEEEQAKKESNFEIEIDN